MTAITTKLSDAWNPTIVSLVLYPNRGSAPVKIYYTFKTFILNKYLVHPMFFRTLSNKK